MKKGRFTIRFLSFLMLAVIAITACEDEYSEEDLLQDQANMANKQDSVKRARQVKALNDAGAFISHTMKVVTEDEDGNLQPVSGAEVKIAGRNANDSSVNSTIATTDEDGYVSFDSVTSGGNLATISADGFMTANVELDFGSINAGDEYQIVDGQVIPQQKNTSTILSLLPSDASNGPTATIEGHVEIETDATNDTTEVLDGIDVKANFSNFVQTESSNVSVSLYTVSSESFGRATTDGNGDYSMVVPSTIEGSDIDVYFPNITRDKRMAVNGVDGSEFDEPQYYDVPTSYGPSINNYTNNTPSIPGAKAVFDMPADPGRGFTFGNFTKIGRSLSGTFGKSYANVPYVINYWKGKFNSFGEGYESSPDITIDDPTGSGAFIEAHIEVAIQQVTVEENGGTGNGYVADQDYTFDLRYDDVFYNNSTNSLDTTFEHYEDNFTITIPTDGNGEFVQDSVDKYVNEAIANGDDYFDADDLEQINDHITNLRLVNTSGSSDAVLSISQSIGSVYQISTTNGGENYTDPSLSFSGGGASTQASFETLEYGTRWTFDVDNSGVTTPYPILPQEVAFKYYEVETGTVDQLTDDDAINMSTGAFSDILDDLLEVDGNGDIQFIDQTATYRTDFYSDQAPEVVVTKNTATQASASLDINSDGTIDNTPFFSTNTGNGYSEEFGVTIEPTISGAPGSGAEINLNSFDIEPSGEYQWNGGYTIVDQGEGYLQNLNQIPDPHDNFNNDQGTLYNDGRIRLDVRAGETYELNVDYGTGLHKVDVQ